MSEICLKLTTKTQERHHLHLSSVFIANFEQISHCSCVSIAEWNVNASWVLQNYDLLPFIVN